MNVFGDFILLQVCYFFYIFNMMAEVEINFAIGYFPIALVGFYILTCLIIVIVSTVKFMKTRTRVCCAKKKFKR